MDDKPIQVKPRGKPLNLSAVELRRLAQITDEDFIRAQKRWVKSVPRWAKNLLLTGG